MMLAAEYDIPLWIVCAALGVALVFALLIGFIAYQFSRRKEKSRKPPPLPPPQHHR